MNEWFAWLVQLKNGNTRLQVGIVMTHENAKLRKKKCINELTFHTDTVADKNATDICVLKKCKAVVKIILV